MARARKQEAPPGSFAAAVKAWRKYLKLTQAQLEDRLGKTGGTVSGLEGGGTRYTQEHVDLLAEAFHCTPVQVFLGPPDPANPQTEIIANLQSLNAEQLAAVAAVVRSYLKAKAA